MQPNAVFTGNYSPAAAPFNAAGDPSGMPSANPSNFGNPTPPVGMNFANYNKPSLFGPPSAVPVISGQTAIFGGVPAPQSPTYSQTFTSQSQTFHPIPSFSQAPKPPSIFSNTFTSSPPAFLNPVMPPPIYTTNINTNTTTNTTTTNNKKHQYISPNSKVTNNNHVV